jgi:glycosyltransferase involved in cell wall biosynthesis
VTVHIACATYNGAKYLEDFLKSLVVQTHPDWRLYVRDDASTDASAAIVWTAARKDARIELVHVAEHDDRLGAARSFLWLVARLPAEAMHVMFADQDDVWKPDKIERTLATMIAAETELGAHVPLLVHTDLTVTDGALQEIHPSFWTYSRIHPEPATFKRIVSHNVTTGATVMFNRALRDWLRQPPADVAMHDWWCACVASAFGRVIAIHEPTILYRQHGTNAIGAKDKRLRLTSLPRAILARRHTTVDFRRGLDRAARQANAFLHRYGSWLSEADQRFLSAYASIPQRPFLRRKLDLLRLRVLPDQGVLHVLGVLIRG